MSEQPSMFSFLYEKKIINKPIRLIEFFAGIGAQYKALKQLTNNVESYKTCEWACNSIIAYDAIHNHICKNEKMLDKEFVANELYKLGVSLDYNQPAKIEQLKRLDINKLNYIYESIQRNHNLVNIMSVKGVDLEIVDTDKYEYILTYSFPCQDLSLAGKRAGMSVSQAEGGTRSGLLWEVERILTELAREREHLPQILVMENVPEVVGSNNIKDFQKWEGKLTELGYKNYVEILNGKNYGIPQNRRRCFMVSILGDYSFEFAEKIDLKYKLKDMLETNVDEKYYLSDKMIQYISAENDKWTGNNGGAIVNREIGCTINTAPTQRRRDASNYIADDLPQNADIRKVGNYGNGHHAKDIYDTDGIMATITTGNHGLGQTIAIKNKTKKGYLEAHEGDGVDISGRMESHRGTVQEGVAHTIDTKNSAGGVVIKK